MSGIPFTDIVRWLGEDGHLVDQITVIGAPMTQEIAGACVDSRLARPGCLFVALPGENTDGHNYVDQAVQGGASCALVAADRFAQVRRRVFGSVRLLPVDDTLAALQSLALRWRREFPELVRVGITGSNGKTSTKEMVASILSRISPTISSHGNYNSDIGLPMELLRIRPEHRYGVFEMGMNRVGEMRLLAGLVEPDVAIVTNIGRAHAGMVGSVDGVAREKREIFSHLGEQQIAIVPAGDHYANYLVAGVEGCVIRFDFDTAGIERTESHGIDGSLLVAHEGEISLPLAGSQMVTNALAAITAARALGTPFSAIREGLESLSPVFGRAEIIRGEITIIQDCYNANPESMEAALALLAGTRTSGRRIAILGAMKELGEEGAEWHLEMARAAVECRFDSLWFVGDEFRAGAEEASAVGGSASTGKTDLRFFANDEWDALCEAVRSVHEGDIVLLKGSRALALERLTAIMQGSGVWS